MLILDQTKLDIMLPGRKGATPRRRTVTVMTDAFSRMIVGFVISEEETEDAPETVLAIRDSKGTAFQSEEVTHLPGRLDVRLDPPFTLRPDYKGAVERLFSSLARTLVRIPCPGDSPHRHALPEVEEKK